MVCETTTGNTVSITASVFGNTQAYNNTTWYVKPLRVTLYQSLLQCLVTLRLITLFKPAVNRKAQSTAISHVPFGFISLNSTGESPQRASFGRVLLYLSMNVSVASTMSSGATLFWLTLVLPNLTYKASHLMTPLIDSIRALS